MTVYISTKQLSSEILWLNCKQKNGKIGIESEEDDENFQRRCGGPQGMELW